MRYRSARQMIFDAYRMQQGDSVLAGAIQKARWGVDVQMSRRNNNDWRIVDGLEAGAVISVVESLPEHLRCLALYLFGPESRRDMAEEAEIVTIALYRELLADGIKLPGQGKGKPTAEQLETLWHLCAAALYHHSEVTWPYSRVGLATPRAVQGWLADETGVEIDVRRWSAVGRSCWSNVWEKLLMELDSYEESLLSPISMLVKNAA